MIDLHLHLDGSLTAQDVLELASIQKLSLPANSEQALEKLLRAPHSGGSLNEYLKRFNLPLLVLQTKEALYGGIYRLAGRLSRQWLCYAEIRFAPQLHLRGGLTMERVCAAACEGLARALEDFPTVKLRLILCCMRGGEIENNRKTVELAADLCDRGVCAVDLAGAEALYETGDYDGIFSYARQLHVPFTIHAGEAAGPESIKAALRLGAARIGHGVRAAEDDSLMLLLAQNKIPLECCPTSNVQTGAVPEYGSHPILKLLERGVPVTVNTDNMTVSNTTIKKEFALLQQHLGMTRAQEKQMLLNSVQAAFLPERERQELHGKVLREFSEI